METAFRHVSYPEQYIGAVCKNSFKHVELNKRMGNNMEADIAIWDINTIIEYNGAFWHKNGDRDIRKKKYIESFGVRLIRIWDTTTTMKSEAYANRIAENEIVFNRYGREMELVIDVLSEVLGVKLNTNGIDENYILEMVNTNIRNQNLQFQYPEIAAELLDGDHSKIFVSDWYSRRWKCKTCGNIFKTAVCHRVYRNTSCPYCAGNKAIPGKTDIITVLPEFAHEIISLTEAELRNTLPYSTKEVTWKCSRCGKTWDSKIKLRTQLKTRCPFCSYSPIIAKQDKISIYDLAKNAKPLKNAWIFGIEVNKPTYTEIFSLFVSYIFKNYDKSLNLVDNINFVTSKNKVPVFSKDISVYNIAGCIDVLEENIYYEKKYGSATLIVILLRIIKTLEISADNFSFEYDVDKINKKHIKYISQAKNGVDWNVTYRLRIHENDVETQMVFIGSRHTFNDAVLLKLSSEIYYFGKIRDNTDAYSGDIPKFESTPEFEKLKQAGKIRKQYS